MNTPRLRDALLAAEPPSPDLEGRHRERLRLLTEHRLTGIERWTHAFGLALGLLLAARFVQLFAQHRADGRPVALVGIAVGFAFSAGWALAAANVLRSGVDRMFTNGTTRDYLVVAFTFLLTGLMLWAGLESPDPVRGTQLIMFGLVFWCAIGLPFLLSQHVRQAELRVRADVLRLELALAERTGAPEEPR